MIIISIPRYVKINDERGEFTAFEVHVAKPGGTVVVEKRYSHFAKLDKRLRKIGVDTPNLPPKTLMNKGSKLLETRRDGLERFLQKLVGIVDEEVYGMLSEFLETQLPTALPSRPRAASSADELDAEEYSPQITHQSVLLFSEDPVMHFYQREGNFLEDWNSIPDTVIRGAMAGIYEENTQIPCNLNTS